MGEAKEVLYKERETERGVRDVEKRRKSERGGRGKATKRVRESGKIKI